MRSRRQKAWPTHHVARARGGLDDEALLVELLEHVADDLAHALFVIGCWCGWLINQPINQLSNRSINLSINQSTNQSIDQSISRSINRPTNQSIDQPINQHK